MEKEQPTPFKPAEWHKLGAWAEYVLGTETWFHKPLSDVVLREYGSRPIMTL